MSLVMDVGPMTTSLSNTEHTIRWCKQKKQIWIQNYIKVLKRSGVGSNDLLYFHAAVIRPILVYACVVWHHNLTVQQSDKIESHQKQAENYPRWSSIWNALW